MMCYPPKQTGIVGWERIQPATFLWAQQPINTSKWVARPAWHRVNTTAATTRYWDASPQYWRRRDGQCHPFLPQKNPACLCLPISNIFCVRGGESSKQSPLIPLHAWWYQPSFGEWESTSTKRLTRPTQIADTNLYPDLSFQGPPLTHSSHRSRRPWNPFRQDKCRVARDSNNL